ncbi:MAG: pyruvate formate lyase family protein [Candidatus Sumerlaeota bacterium]
MKTLVTDNWAAEIRESLLEKDERLGYVEREEALAAFCERSDSFPAEERMARAFEAVCERMTPIIHEQDRLLGRMKEGYLQDEDDLPEAYEDWKPWVHHTLLFSPGHMTLDHETAIQEGLSGIRQRAEKAAECLGTEQARCMATNAKIVEQAVKKLCARFARAAREMAARLGNPTLSKNLTDAAEAMERVPVEPARNFHEALQCAWSVHWICSSILGGRDFGWGAFDQYLWPFYRDDIESGELNREGAKELLIDFLLKTNEIAGNARGMHFYKPTPPQSSKQYLFLGGVNAEGHGRRLPVRSP